MPDRPSPQKTEARSCYAMACPRDATHRALTPMGWRHYCEACAMAGRQNHDWPVESLARGGTS